VEQAPQRSREFFFFFFFFKFFYLLILLFARIFISLKIIFQKNCFHRCWRECATETSAPPQQQPNTKSRSRNRNRYAPLNIFFLPFISFGALFSFFNNEIIQKFFSSFKKQNKTKTISISLDCGVRGQEREAQEHPFAMLPRDPGLPRGGRAAV
jgi:hypothetical protein